MKKINISVGTSAYNEEQNIQSMIMSVLSQKGISFRIVEIIINSDGSNDNTLVRVKEISDKRIKILDDGKRKGQPARIGELLEIFNGDILALIDSDMLLKDRYVFERIAKKFLRDKNISLICGNTIPVKSQTFVERAINSYKEARASLEKEYAFGDSAFAAHAFLIYSRRFGKKLKIPEKILNPDAYSYFACKAVNCQTYFSSNIAVFYRSPQTIKDHYKQSIRHLAGGRQLQEYFGRSTVEREFYVPRNIIIKLILKQLKGNPFGYLYVKLLYGVVTYLANKNYSKIPVKWEVIASSKFIKNYQTSVRSKVFGVPRPRITASVRQASRFTKNSQRLHIH